MPVSHFDRAFGGRRLSTRRLAVAVGLFFVAALATACSHAERGVAHPTLTSGGGADVGVTLYSRDHRQHAPNLVGPTLAGNKFSLDQADADRVVVLNVWASWCAPCRDESPMLAALAKRLQGDDVDFVGLDERDTTAQARAFVTATHSPYPHLVDKDGSLLLKLRILPQVAIPSTLVLDRRGRMAARVIGPITAAALRHIIDELGKES
jgi:thiol-disulfide isomerase/thioredoxin